MTLDTIMFAGHDERLSGKPQDVNQYFEEVEIEEGETDALPPADDDEFKI